MSTSARVSSEGASRSGTHSVSVVRAGTGVGVGVGVGDGRISGVGEGVGEGGGTVGVGVDMTTLQPFVSSNTDNTSPQTR
ncbi:MAG: hypothetical protein DRI37_06585 [Chloroflexi bacterium]|nr:MAG: hypothetical protein DRI37_06585 [Chloroflexota bacterium]